MWNSNCYLTCAIYGLGIVPARAHRLLIFVDLTEDCISITYYRFMVPDDLWQVYKSLNNSFKAPRLHYTSPLLCSSCEGRYLGNFATPHYFTVQYIMFSWAIGPRFNIKMSSYQYKKSHCGDKTVVRSSYLHNVISYTGKISSSYWIGALVLTKRFL